MLNLLQVGGGKKKCMILTYTENVTLVTKLKEIFTPTA